MNILEHDFFGTFLRRYLQRITGILTGLEPSLESLRLPDDLVSDHCAICPLLRPLDWVITVSVKCFGGIVADKHIWDAVMHHDI